VPVVGVLIFVFAMGDIWPLENHWLPKNINEEGRTIDSLFMFILVLTGIIFVGTSLALFWFLWKYDAAKNTEPVKYTHGSHTLEVIWSILPAAALLFIALFQMPTWSAAKLDRPTIEVNGRTEPKPPLALVTGRQFEWRIQYAGEDKILGLGPGPDGELGTGDDLCDDVFLVNELHVPKDESVVLQIESADVLHSFFLPNMRTKQDVVPGMRQFVWFNATENGRYDIVCAELCGWGHYKMRGELTVESREDFDNWLAAKRSEQQQSSYTKPELEEE